MSEEIRERKMSTLKTLHRYRCDNVGCGQKSKWSERLGPEPKQSQASWFQVGVTCETYSEDNDWFECCSPACLLNWAMEKL